MKRDSGPPSFPADRRLPPAAWCLVALVLVATAWPGIMSNDSVAMLEQARSLAFTDWHPPVMALLWAPLDRLAPGPGLMLIAQATLYALGMAWLCAEAFPSLLARIGPWLAVRACSWSCCSWILRSR